MFSPTILANIPSTRRKAITLSTHPKSKTAQKAPRIKKTFISEMRLLSWRNVVSRCLNVNIKAKITAAG